MHSEEERDRERVHSRHPAGAHTTLYLLHSIAWVPALQLWPTILMIVTRRYYHITLAVPLWVTLPRELFLSFPLLSPSSTRPTSSLLPVPAFLLTLCCEASLLSLTATDFLDGTPLFLRALLIFISRRAGTQRQVYIRDSTVINLTNNTRSRTK